MDENKKDSFWESKDDDFWSKSVVTDDWLKNEATERNERNPYLRKDAANVQDNSWYHNPNEHASYLNGQPIETKMGNDVSSISNPTTDKPKKQMHVHMIICLCFITITVLCVISSIIIYMKTKHKAIEMTEEISYKKTACESNYFMYDENNSVEITEAVAIISEENFTGFPTGQNLVCIPIQVLSEKYVSDAYVMKDLYIGYEVEGRYYYQDLPRKDTVYPYVSPFGFTREEILDNYGLGNGWDDIGYLFFFVPSEVNEITLYMPKTETKNGIRLITEVLFMEMPVIHTPLGKEANDETGH